MYFSQMSFLFFDEGLYERLTIMDHFKFYKDINESNQSIDQILKLTHLETKKKIKIRNLSSSEKRRVLFARMLFQNPALYIFEEPELNVDVETKRVFLNIIEILQQDGKEIGRASCRETV